MDLPLTPRQRRERDERIAAAGEAADRFAGGTAAAERELAAESAWRVPVAAEVWGRINERAAASPLRGCEVCEAKAYTGRHEPYLVDSVVMQTRLWRCSACGTFWNETQRAVFAMTPGEVRSVYQEFRDNGEAPADPGPPPGTVT
nr:hypothetical protein [uncultured Actinotalea sp.]